MRRARSKQHVRNKRCPRKLRCHVCARLRDKDNTRNKAKYARRRAWAIAYLGGCCSVCCSTNELEVDHIDPSQKTMKFAHGCSEQRFRDEIERCQLLCHDCHVEKTKSDKQLRTVDNAPF